MTVKEIIDGLKFTIDMFLFDPTMGETFTEPRNDMDKTTIDACKGAIELLEQTQWIPCSERLPEIHNSCQLYLVTYKQGQICTAFYSETNGRSWWSIDGVEAWMPLPTPYQPEISTVAESEEVE